jgi:hypothetical protein
MTDSCRQALQSCHAATQKEGLVLVRGHQSKEKIVTSQRTKTKSELTRKGLIAATALTAFAVVGIASSSAATQHHRRLYMMVLPQSQEIARPQSQESPRDAALRACNGEASKWTDRDWETTKAATYQNCMTNHGQTP